MSAVPGPIDEAQLEEIDAAYVPFPGFSEWAGATEVSSAWDDATQNLESVASKVNADTLSGAVEMVMRAAAIDSGAIEGLYDVNEGITLTVATQAAAWQESLKEAGANVRALFEAQLSGYQMVLDAATEARPVTEAFVRQVHEVVCRPQEEYVVQTPVGSQTRPLPKGEYKHDPNHVVLPDGSTFSYAPVQDVSAEMHRFVEELASDTFARAHPVVQAAFAHHAFVRIHPFADGNGRVARALASIFTYRAARIPLLVFADRKPAYLKALRSADGGAVQPLVQFVLECCLSALNLTAESLVTAAAPKPEDELDSLHHLLTAQGGLTHQQMDGVGRAVQGLLASTVVERIEALAPRPGVSMRTAWAHGEFFDPQHPHFRSFNPQQYLQVSIELEAPAAASALINLMVLVSGERDEAESVMIYGEVPPERVMFALSDLHPNPTMAAQERLRELADRTLGRLLATAKPAAIESLRASGYLAPE